MSFRNGLFASIVESDSVNAKSVPLWVYWRLISNDIQKLHFSSKTWQTFISGYLYRLGCPSNYDLQGIAWIIAKYNGCCHKLELFEKFGVKRIIRDEKTIKFVEKTHEMSKKCWKCHGSGCDRDFDYNDSFSDPKVDLMQYHQYCQIMNDYELGSIVKTNGSNSQRIRQWYKKEQKLCPIALQCYDCINGAVINLFDNQFNWDLSIEWISWIGNNHIIFMTKSRFIDCNYNNYNFGCGNQFVRNKCFKRVYIAKIDRKELIQKELEFLYNVHQEKIDGDEGKQFDSGIYYRDDEPDFEHLEETFVGEFNGWRKISQIKRRGYYCGYHVNEETYNDEKNREECSWVDKWINLQTHLIDRYHKIHHNHNIDLSKMNCFEMKYFSLLQKYGYIDTISFMYSKLGHKLFIVCDKKNRKTKKFKAMIFAMGYNEEEISEHQCYRFGINEKRYEKLHNHSIYSFHSCQHNANVKVDESRRKYVYQKKRKTKNRKLNCKKLKRKINYNNKNEKWQKKQVFITKFGANNNDLNYNDRIKYISLINGYTNESQNIKILSKLINPKSKHTFLLKIPMITHKEKDDFMLHPLYLNENGWHIFDNVNQTNDKTKDNNLNCNSAVVDLYHRKYRNIVSEYMWGHRRHTRYGPWYEEIVVTVACDITKNDNNNNNSNSSNHDATKCKKEYHRQRQQLQQARTSKASCILRRKIDKDEKIKNYHTFCYANGEWKESFTHEKFCHSSLSYPTRFENAKCDHEIVTGIWCRLSE